MRLPASQPLPRPPPFAGGGGRSGPSTGGRRQSFVVSWGMAEAVVAGLPDLGHMQYIGLVLNKRGYLRDGLHCTGYGAKRIAAKIIERLSTIWPDWAARLAPTSWGSSRRFR